MVKRPKNWTPTPKERNEQRMKARARIRSKGDKVAAIGIDKFGTGFGTIPEIPGGYYQIPNPPQKYWYDEFGEWQKEYEAMIETAKETKKQEKPKDPLTKFTDDWYERNK